MPSKELQNKTSLAFDDRMLKTFRKQAGRLNLSVSGFLRLVAAKLESVSSCLSLPGFDRGLRARQTGPVRGGSRPPQSG